MRRTVAWIGAALIAAGTISGCGTERSVDAYCKTFWGQGSALRSQWTASANSGDLLNQFTSLMSAPQDLEIFFDKLDKVAPDDIESDVAVVRDSLQKQIDAVGSSSPTSLLGTAWQQLAIGLTSQGSWRRVDQYTSAHCGTPPQG